MDSSDKERKAKQTVFCMFKSEQSIDALIASAKAAILEVLPNANISQEDSILNIDGIVKASIRKGTTNEVTIKFEYPAEDYKKYVDAFMRVGSKHESAILFIKKMD